MFLTPDKFKTEEELVMIVKKIQNYLKSGRSVTSLVKKYSSGAYATKGGASGDVDSSQLRPEISNILSQI